MNYKTLSIVLLLGCISTTAIAAEKGGSVKYGPVITVKPKGKEQGPKKIQSKQGTQPQATGLLLPAVQKARSTAGPAGK